MACGVDEEDVAEDAGASDTSTEGEMELDADVTAAVDPEAAEVETEASPLATIVTPAPAALVVVPAMRPGRVSVAESIDAILLELVEAAC